MYIDSHAHLEGRRYDADREAVIARAWEAGVSTIVAIGNGDGPAEVDCGIKLAEAYSSSGMVPQVRAKERREPGPPRYDRMPSHDGVSLHEHTSSHDAKCYPVIYATIGIHPHEAQLADQAAYDRMSELAKHPKVIAWGEIGLDYFYDHSPREVQQRVFRAQMELARAARLPIVIHCRPSEGSENAWEDCLRMMQEQWAPSGLGGILHCFTGNSSQAKRALEMGFMVSFAGNVTFPKAQQIRDAALKVPLERMLIETDSPYLAPIPHRGKRNEPAYVKEVARQLGELRGRTGDEIGELTSQNFESFFSLHEKDATV
jgi:TatD DNase family protein